jgi:hypothetical protein
MWIWAILALVCAGAWAQDRQPERFVVDPRATCHVDAETSATAGRKIAAGSRFFAAAVRHEGPGMWYLFGTDPVCWVDGRFTRVGLGDDASNWIGILEYMSARKDAALGEYIAVDDELALARVKNPRMEFRRLQMLQAALGSYDVVRGKSYSKSEIAWLASHGTYFEPDGEYSLPAGEFWKLYDANRDLPWAEEIAWAAASIRPGADECTSPCIYGLIEQMDVPYWTRLPAGAHVDAVLDQAADFAKGAAEMACFDVDRGHPAEVSSSPVEEDDLRRIRESLTNVSPAAKQPLLGYLDLALKNCVDAAR